MTKTLHDGTVVADEIPTKSTSLGRFLIEGQELADLNATKAQFVIDRAAEIAAQPLRDWEFDLVVADKSVSRVEEDLFDSMTDTQQEKVDQHTKNKIAAKKTLRGQRP